MSAILDERNDLSLPLLAKDNENGHENQPNEKDEEDSFQDVSD